MAGGTIMVVDDDPAVVKTLERVLAVDGYRVHGFSSTQAALDSIADERPDLILLDLLMPQMNGRQFLEYIREQLDAADIPVILITGVRGIDIKQAVSMGASDVIEKPFNMEQLLNKVALVLFRVERAREGGDESAVATPVSTRRTGEFSALAPPGIVVLISADTGLQRRIQTLVTGNGQRLVPLARASHELPRVVRALRPHAVLIDLHIPSSGGMAALRRLRSRRVLDHLPMLLISTQLEDLDRARDELVTLAAASLLQPFEDEELISFLAHPPATASRSVSVV